MLERLHLLLEKSKAFGVEKVAFAVAVGTSETNDGHAAVCLN